MARRDDVDRYEIDTEPDPIVATLRPDLDSVEPTVALVGFVGPSRRGSGVRLYSSVDFDTYYEIAVDDILSRSRANSSDDGPSTLRVKASAKLDIVSSRSTEARYLSRPSTNLPVEPSAIGESNSDYPHNLTGDKVRDIAYSQLGQRVGRGECTDLVDLALDVAGARPGNNYVWGTEITQRPPQFGTWQNGDIIQFWNAHFQWTEGGATHTWGVGRTGRHTAIILNATFSNSGPWDTWLIHQNDGVRWVTERQLYLARLVSGQFIVYRPIPL